MRSAEVQALATETGKLVSRLVELDTKLLNRPELGQLSFAEAMPLFEKLIDLYRQINVDDLTSLSRSALTRIRESANADYAVVTQIEKFDIGQSNPKSARDNIIATIDSNYDRAFEQLRDSISFFQKKTMDFGALDRSLRAAIQGGQDAVAKAIGELTSSGAEAQSILENIRKAAAEQGVSQQAVYFKNQADLHEKQAAIWLTRVRNLVISFGLLALAAVVLVLLKVLVASDATAVAQLIAAKVLLFGTLAFAVSLSAKIYAAHAHNEVVNRHRQNSLATFKSLVDAASHASERDVVLSKAADSIFSPASTGFQKEDGGDSVSISSLVNSLPSTAKNT